jgi:hypothetical protein
MVALTPIVAKYMTLALNTLGPAIAAQAVELAKDGTKEAGGWFKGLFKRGKSKNKDTKEIEGDLVEALTDELETHLSELPDIQVATPEDIEKILTAIAELRAETVTPEELTKRHCEIVSEITQLRNEIITHSDLEKLKIIGIRWIVGAAVAITGALYVLLKLT